MLLTKFEKSLDEGGNKNLQVIVDPSIHSLMNFVARDVGGLYTCIGERSLSLDELLMRPSPKIGMKVFKQSLSHWSIFPKALQLLSTLLFIGEFVERGSGRESSHRWRQMFQQKTEVGIFGNSLLSFLAL